MTCHLSQPYKQGTCDAIIFSILGLFPDREKPDGPASSVEGSLLLWHASTKTTSTQPATLAAYPEPFKFSARSL